MTPAPSLGLPETPLFFAADDRPRFGVFHAPAGPRRGTAVVVHVHGFGVEQITAYRAEVRFARAAAAAGHPVFRFHARGHGDSTGDFADVALDSLAEDARLAADQAKRLAETPGVVFLGVRFGALVAARAQAGRSDVRGLALWEPVHDGRDFFRGQLRSMLFSQVAAGVRPEKSADQLLEDVERDGAVDLQGYLVHRTIVRSSRDARLDDALATWSGPTFLAQIQGRAALAAPHQRLVDALGARGASVRTFLRHEDPGWPYIQNPAWECPPLVDATREWLDGLA